MHEQTKTIYQSVDFRTGKFMLILRVSYFFTQMKFNSLIILSELTISQKRKNLHLHANFLSLIL